MMGKHKSKLERYRDICESVFFSEEREIKPVPYQVAQDIDYPQSHTTSYMNELADKGILVKHKNGLYSLPEFDSLDQLEKKIEKKDLGKYYPWKVLDELRRNLEKEGVEEVDNAEVHKGSEAEEEWFRIRREKDKINKEISYSLDIIKEYPLSLFVISKKDLVKWIRKETERLEDAAGYEELESIAFNIDLVIKLLEDSAKVLE